MNPWTKSLLKELVVKNAKTNAKTKEKNLKNDTE